MQKRIYREQIIKALLTEPLAAGYWVEKPQLQFVGECTVCAVGAIMRSACKLPNNDVQEACGNNTPGLVNAFTQPTPVVEKHLRNRNFLSALSVYFESMLWNAQFDTKRNVTPEDRVNLCQFVLKNFPQRITVELPTTFKVREDA